MSLQQRDTQPLLLDKRAYQAQQGVMLRIARTPLEKVTDVRVARLAA